MDSKAYARLYPHDAYAATLERGARDDGRPLGRARACSLACGVVSAANVRGSCVAKRGHTTAAAAVRCAVATPDARAPGRGFVDVDVTFATQCGETQRPGRGCAGRDSARETAREALASASAVDAERLCIERGVAVWRVRVDVVILDDDGCAGDCALLAAIGALRDCVLPRAHVERGKVVLEDDVEGEDPSTSTAMAVDEDGAHISALVVNNTPVSLTTALYKGHLIVDPTREEEALSRCLVSVCLTEDGMIRGVFKRGGEVEATEDILMKCIAAAKHNYSATKQVIEESMADDTDADE